MTVLSAGEVAGLRSAFAQWRTETCEIRRATAVNDGRGSELLTYSPLATVSCKRTPETVTGRASEATVGGRASGETYWSISLPAGTDVANGDRLLVGSRTYEVTGVIDKTIELQRDVRAVEIV